MGDSYVQVPADGVGKKLQSFENVIGANTVQAEAITLVDSTGAETVLATETTVDTVHGHVHSMDGKITACDTTDVAVTSSTLPTGAATEATIHNNIEHQMGASRSANPIDYVGITYNADGTVNVITAKTAVAGTTIWTLTCAYTSGNLTSITRT